MNFFTKKSQSYIFLDEQDLTGDYHKLIEQFESIFPGLKNQVTLNLGESEDIFIPITSVLYHYSQMIYQAGKICHLKASSSLIELLGSMRLLKYFSVPG